MFLLIIRYNNLTFLFYTRYAPIVFEGLKMVQNRMDTYIDYFRYLQAYHYLRVKEWHSQKCIVKDYIHVSPQSRLILG